jgi:hypothetical protein
VAVEITPLVALRRPVREPMVMLGAVRVPLLAMEVVAEPPIARVLAEKSVEVAPPKKRTKVVVELPVAAKG